MAVPPQQSSIGTMLLKQWFLVGMVSLAALGISLGYGPLQGSVDMIDTMIDSRVLTAVVLFLMSVTLDSKALVRSMRSPGPVLWASVVNCGLLPILAWLMMPVQLAEGFAVGLVITTAAPCTMASASVWTRRAGGNDAVSLLVTILTNGFCFLITPFWLIWTLGSMLDQVVSVSLDPVSMIKRLLIAVVIPMAIGQLVRLKGSAARFATEKKVPLGVAAQSLLLLLIFVASLKAGERLSGPGAGPGLDGLLVVLVSGVMIHFVALIVGYQGGALLRFSRPDRIAIAFAGSQKTLAIGVLVANSVAESWPFAVFPIMLYHASQLVLDTIVADRFANSDRQQSSDEPPRAVPSDPPR